MESTPGIFFRNSIGIYLLKSSSASCSLIVSLSLFSPILPILAIFYKSGSLRKLVYVLLISLKISAVCYGPLDHKICKFGKCRVNNDNLEIILVGLMSPLILDSYAGSCSLNGIVSSNSIKSMGLL